MNTEEQPKDQLHFWLSHDRLTIDQVCSLARGVTPTEFNVPFYRLGRMFRTCPYYSLLMNAIYMKEIKSAHNNKVSPLESFLFFQSKGLALPPNLSHLLENELDGIQVKLKKKVKRTKESYQREEVRGDDNAFQNLYFQYWSDLALFAKTKSNLRSYAPGRSNYLSFPSGKSDAIFAAKADRC